MNPKKRYRRFLLWCLGLDLLVIGILGIRYLNLKIPDEIHVEKGKDQDVSAMLAQSGSAIIKTIRYISL